MDRDRDIDDIETFKAVRESVGDDVAVMADCNQYLKKAEMLERCHILDDMGLEWLEEPILYDKLEGYA